MRHIRVRVTCSTATLSLLIFIGACRQPAPSPVTLSYFRPGWSQADPNPDILSSQFTQATGIRVKNLPVPEGTLDTLSLSRKLLSEAGAGPDVFFVDLIWSGALADDLLDLSSYFQSELGSFDSQLMPSYTVGKKIVAIPYQAQVGVLEYRADLLRAYGYDHPPKTWDQLENMAVRIQRGERAKGNKRFWGYVWQGGAVEALTCNALEWQVAAGGGTIIESDHTISVNNPSAIRAWERARHWIGWISPPGVAAYGELDSTNVFDSGRAAFARVWHQATIEPSGHPPLIHWLPRLTIGTAGYTPIPGGPAGQAGALGGFGLAVSRHSRHPREAVDLVRFLIQAQIQSSTEEVKAIADQSTSTMLPQSSPTATPVDSSDGSASGKIRLVSRPSSLSGQNYEQVTRAYIRAVHSVLADETRAPEAALKLEAELARITGFRSGLPKKAD